MANMIKDGKLDDAKLEKTVDLSIRMLDNVIDNNFYPTEEAKAANLRHRAVGLGLMGYQDALFKLNIPFDSEDNLEFADQSMEMISYYAIKASSKLAKERGSYSTFQGSKWEKGIFPLDSLGVLEQERDRKILVSRKSRMDWDSLKAFVKQNGMRNSNMMAIAPTATIANISGVFPCTEPVYKNIYMKENLSGNFIVINRYLIDDLERLGLWNSEILNKVKLNNGSVKNIKELPDSIKNLYKETFEIEPEWIVKAAALRSKWIDQSASTNVFVNTKSGKAISDAYQLAWEYGLKTTYYLRTLGASQVQKATVDIPQAEEEPTGKVIQAVELTENVGAEPVEIKACLIADPSCEACQ